MVIEAHIGLLNEPGFDFYGGDYSGNIPKRLSPLLPNGSEVHAYICRLERNGENEARQLDWGAFGAIFTKQQLADFVDFFYKKGSANEIRKFIKGLDAEQKYVLVAYETGEDSGE